MTEHVLQYLHKSVEFAVTYNESWSQNKIKFFASSISSRFEKLHIKIQTAILTQRFNKLAKQAVTFNSNRKWFVVI